MVLVTFVRVWKIQKVRKGKMRQQERHHCSFVCTGSLNVLNNPSFWFSWPFSMNCIELDKSFTLVCQGRYYRCQALRRESHWGAERKSRDLKRFSSRNRCAGATGGTRHVSMRMHAFPCESISEAGVHYQDNGTADGCSCHTRPSALEEHHRQAVLLRGRPGGESQVRAGQPGVVWATHWILLELSKSQSAFSFFHSDNKNRGNILYLKI